MASRGCLAKQVHSCLTALHSFTDGQVQMVDMNWDTLEHMTIEIQPNDGIYKNNRFTFRIIFHVDTYPNSAPEITCLTKIYHPNIDAESDDNNVCVSLINDWTSSNTVEDIILTLLFLMYNPNTSDPLSGFVSSDIDQQSYEDNQAAIMRGENPFKEQHDLSQDFFKEAQQKFKDLSEFEWDVLGAAAKAEWEYKLQQEKWQTEMKEWEKEQAEEQAKKEEEERLAKLEEQRLQTADTASIDAAQNQSPSFPQIQKSNSFLTKQTERQNVTSINHAFGKSSLQRCSTVAMTNGQAAFLGFHAPEKSMVNQWNIGLSIPETEERQEEEMDCSEAPSSLAVTNDNPIVWRAFCETNVFDRPSLKRGVTF